MFQLSPDPEVEQDSVENCVKGVLSEIVEKAVPDGGKELIMYDIVFIQTKET